jgi:FHA domain/Domain of unknown function (DUF1707)
VVAVAAYDRFVSQQRLSHRVRERAIGRLQHGYVTGALGTQTFEHRLETALSCQSPGVLRQLTSDLVAWTPIADPRRWFASVWDEPAFSGLLACLATSAPTVIGRMPSCDFVVSDDSVSRRHAMLIRQGDRVILTDLASTNGTFLNGRWTAQAEVRPGDRVRFGKLELRL